MNLTSVFPIIWIQVRDLIIFNLLPQTWQELSFWQYHCIVMSDSWTTEQQPSTVLQCSTYGCAPDYPTLFILALETSIFSCVKRCCKASIIQIWFTKKRHINREKSKTGRFYKECLEFLTEMSQGAATHAVSLQLSDSPSYSITKQWFSVYQVDNIWQSP